jgi:hypothetical protein
MEELCAKRPSSIVGLMTITGIGQRKAHTYGAGILAALKSYGAGSRASAAVEETIAPEAETLRLLAEGHTLAEIAKIRGRQFTTIVSSVADLVEAGKIQFQPAWIDAAKIVAIQEAAARLGLGRLKLLRNALPPTILLEEIRLVVANLRSNKDKADGVPA